MKKNFFSGVLALALTLFPLMTLAQTVHNVIVGPGYTYTPASLSISTGDIVSWTSEGGTHDVNFATNSITGDSFGNPAEVSSLPTQGTGEMGSITFDVAGTYDYDCSVGQHAANGMIGSISVIQYVEPEPLLITTTVCSDATSVAMTGPWWEWDPTAGAVATDNGDGTWTFTFAPAPTDNMEYLLVVDGVQEDLLNSPHPDLDGDGNGDLWNCTPITDYYSYANRQWTVGSGNVENTYGTCGTCDNFTEPEPETTTATVEFTVDMNEVDQPSADYPSVVVNGSWNGWSGWGVELSDADADGVWTGSLELAPGTTFEYVVAVTGAGDGWSGWGMQWGDGCGNANVSATAGDAGTITASSLTPGCAEILGCMDENASNYDASATAQQLDQYGNLNCLYSSCDDVPQDGCIYPDGFGLFAEDGFNAEECLGYGGIPCESPEAGFYAPEGSTFNEDSSTVYLPSASVGNVYNESITFYSTDEITMNIGGDDVSLGFVSAQIVSVSTPEGMTSTCVPSDCTFGPDAWGEVNINGTPMYGGEYEMALSALVTVNLTNLGIPSDLTFPLPYNGENPILNLALNGSTDYSDLNSFVPSFILQVEGEEDGNGGDGEVDLSGVRYVDQVFADVTVTSNVVYGANIGIITQAPAMENLVMDVYEPTGDDHTNRPVVLLLHTGTFLPAIANGQATGDKSDNNIVELCTRLAQKGYVAVSANYRLGWNPLSTDPDVRTSTLAQAFYRGQQDARTAIRYMRMTTAEMGNPYGIGDQFAVGGDGTGGYISLALSALDKDSEILLPKFLDTSESTIETFGMPIPYIVQSIFGNLGGSNYGSTMMDLDMDGTPETEVPLCVPNHPGYSDAIDMAFNFGGAMLDTSWIEEGEVPIATMQNINDEFAPYSVGVLTEPVNNDPVIEAMGGELVIARATELGNNDCFAGMSTTLFDATYGNGDGAANAAVAGHADMPGLFPLITPAPSATPTICGFEEVNGAPWQWWDNVTYDAMASAFQGQPAGVMGCLALLSNPDMSEEQGLAFVDMQEEFFTPRIVAALDLGPKRYLDNMFDDVTVTSNVVYGANIGIITQTPALENLVMDVYEPTGDNHTNRRVVLLLHTGTFLPAIANGQATGDKSDNNIVELCTRLAQKGYVAVSANYRLGWNPLSTDPDVRTSTLAQAFYRGQQDARTAIRYMRMTTAEMGNPYGIGDQFAVGGDGTGGYISLALSALDKDSEILLPKFLDTSESTIETFGMPIPYIVQSIFGNLGGSNYGSTMMDLDMDGTPETEVPLCVPNHPGYSDAIDMAFNFGGAMLDTSWIEEGEVPIATMQNINDEFAPYSVGVLTEPVNNDPVIEAMGGELVIARATELGNNDCFAGMSTTLFDATYGNGDGAANAAVAGHADMPGLFPLITPAPSATPTICGFEEVNGAPWQWWDNVTYDAMASAFQGQPAGVMGCLALLSNPDMSEEQGLAFVDMQEEFFTPRIHAALSVESNESDNGPSEQAINLASGWSMFSTYMVKDNMEMDAFLADIIDNVIIAKNYLGAAYLPEFGFNGVGDVLIGQGYQIKTTQETTLNVMGTYASPEDNAISLDAGWNMIGYLRTEAAPADGVFAELNNAGNLIIAKDYLGSAYLPEFGFNGIGNLEPGQGYQLKTNEAGTFTYLSNDDSYRLEALNVTNNNLAHFEYAKNTGSNMTIIISENAWEVTPSIGDEIAAFNHIGELIGSAVYSIPTTVLTVWGNDATTEKVDGLNQGESMTFSIWNKRYQNNQTLVVNEWINGTNAFQHDAVYQIGDLEQVVYTSSINQLGLYPIPAKQELNVEVNMNLDESVNIQVFNLIGESVQSNSFNLSKGPNTVKLDVSNLNQGVYLCKINSSKGQILRKFNVIK